MASTIQDPLTTASYEIVRLHAVIEGWFRGTFLPERFDTEFADALHCDFEIIEPAGTVVTRANVLDAFSRAHGTNPDFRIRIDEPRILGVWPGLMLAGYVEHQTGARNSAPTNSRRATVLFQTDERLLWRHLHETDLPLE